MTKRKFDATHAAAHGYTKDDWDAVDFPELAQGELAEMRPFGEVFPDLAASIRKTRGRPKIDEAREAVTLRLAPGTVARFKATGPDWRTKMAQALDKAKAS